MIAWAQEVERYCDRGGQVYDEVVSFYEEIPFFPPVKYFPGVIGGHCVMPNVEILRQLEGSPLLDMIEYLAGYVTTEAPGLNAFAIEDGVV